MLTKPFSFSTVVIFIVVLTLFNSWVMMSVKQPLVAATKGTIHGDESQIIGEL